MLKVIADVTFLKKSVYYISRKKKFDPMSEQETDPRYEFFEGLIRRHRTAVWRLCLRHTKGDADRASDLVQEIWLSLWKYLGTMRPGCSAGQERRWVVLRAKGIIYIQSRRDRQRPELAGTLPEVEDDSARLEDE